MPADKYRCVTCDDVFEIADDSREGSKEVRCPRCHRVHDVVKVERPAEAPWHRRGATMAAVALLAVAGAALVFYVLRTRGSGGGGDAAASVPPIAPASSDEVASLTARAGACAGIEPLAQGGAATADARAKALAALFRCLSASGALEVKDYAAASELGDRPPRDPADLVAGARKENVTATSLEVALVVLRAARSVGLESRIVRVERFPGANIPADPSGMFGHFAVEIGPPRAADAGAGAGGVIIDPSIDAGVTTGDAECRPVDDTEATALLDAYRALREGLPREDAPEPDRLAAREYIDKARRQATRNVTIRLAFALVVGPEDPGTAFAEIEAARAAASPSEKAGIAEWYLGLGKLQEAEKLLDEAGAAYPGWFKVPLVRAQISLLRASALAKAKIALEHPDSLPPGLAAQIDQQMAALGLEKTERPEDHFAAAARAIDQAESMGAEQQAARLRNLQVVTFAEYRMGSGDLEGAEALLEGAGRKDPTSPVLALPRAALFLARDNEAGAREALAPIVTPTRTMDKLLEAARGAADRIRPLIRALETPSPFDLANPGTPVPGTEPSLNPPGMLGDRPRGGLGGGLQLRL